MKMQKNKIILEVKLEVIIRSEMAIAKKRQDEAEACSKMVWALLRKSSEYEKDGKVAPCHLLVGTSWHRKPLW